MSFLVVLVCGLLSIPLFLIGALLVGINTLIEEAFEFITRLVVFALFLLLGLAVFTVIAIVVEGIRENGFNLETIIMIIVVIAMLCFVLSIVFYIGSIPLQILLNIVVIIGAVIQIIGSGAQALGEWSIGASNNMLGIISKHSQEG